VSVSHPAPPARTRLRPQARGPRFRPSRGPRAGRLGWWLIGTAAVVGVAILWVQVTRTRPSYDAFGWMVWGRQVVDHSALNTDGAPSWKPLSFLFTLPYALFGRTQLWLWTVTATAAALSSVVFAARLGFRLSLAGSASGAPQAIRPGRRQTAGALLGGAFAGLAILGLGSYMHQVFIATSDPMVVALVLAAVDAHFARRPRLVLVALLLASLGRPEAWPFLLGYAIWVWRSEPEMRWLAVAALVAVPAAWFVVPGLTSHSWFVSGDLALKSPDALHHHQLAGVVHRFIGLYGVVMWAGVLAAVAIGLLRRDRTSLTLAAAAIGWLLIEVGFAYHGWPASQRYMMEAGAICVVLVGSTLGRLVAGCGGTVDGTARRHVVDGVGVAASVALVIALIPTAAARASLLRRQLHTADRAATRLGRLQQAVDRLGGPSRILGCGHPVTEVGFQSALAWDLGMNVGKVGYKPGREIRSGRALVFFKPLSLGWQVHPIHLPAARHRACAQAMRLNLDSGRPLPPLPPARPRSLQAVGRHHARRRQGHHVRRRGHRRRRAQHKR
jgi:hypothetical protein